MCSSYSPRLHRAALVALSLVSLAACQAGSSGLSPDKFAGPVEGPQSLTSIPDCAKDRTARLAGGLVVGFAGPAKNDPNTCLLTWNGSTHRFILGVLPKARGQRTTPEERDAVRTALLGPVGTKAEFEDKQAALWGRVTVEHVADPVLLLDGKRRRTAELRIVRHDAQGRSNVRAISLHWVDMHTGIALKAEVVTEMDDGSEVTSNTWEVESLG